MQKEKKTRELKILAKGINSNHCHVLFGDVDINRQGNTVSFTVNSSKDIELAEKLFFDYETKLFNLVIETATSKDWLTTELTDIEKAKLFERCCQDLEFVTKRIEFQNEYNLQVEKLDVATIRHILESDWLTLGLNKWTQEHVHIPFRVNEYEYVPQVEFNVLNQLIQNVYD